MTSVPTDSAISTQAPEQGVTEVLIAARKKIEKPEKWLNRYPSAYEETMLRKYCAARAIWCQGQEGVFERAMSALRVAMGVDDLPRGVVIFNDSHTHTEVLAAFDRAIEASRTEEKTTSTEGLVPCSTS